MDSFRVQWKRSAEKDLRKIDPQEIPRIIEATESLEDDPFPPQHRKLQGSKTNYRIRVGDYRIIYHVNIKARIVTVFHIRHRKDAYKR